MQLNVHHIDLSRVNGPGLRLTIWVQGCSLGCKGCFNPLTHNLGAGRSVLVNDLAAQIDKLESIDGVTLSGGEPLDQAQAIDLLVHSLNVPRTWILYTGYTPKEIFRDPIKTRVVKAMDVTLAGRFQLNAPHPYQHKKLILTSDRVSIDFAQPKRTVEFIVSTNGITKTGIPREA